MSDQNLDETLSLECVCSVVHFLSIARLKNILQLPFVNTVLNFIVVFTLSFVLNSIIRRRKETILYYSKRKFSFHR